ncbi:MAG: hypothetical protein NXH70_02240 [Hyphomonas sp.]|nr:hypothetical protein [Hyphomonas sp.]
MTMTRQKCQMIGREAQEALEAVARKHNLTVIYKGGSYDDTNTTLKFLFADETTDGTAMTPEFMALRALYPEIAGYEFYIPGRGYVKPIGWNSRAKKYPLVYQNLSDGKRYKTTQSLLTECTPERRSDA